MDYLSRLHWSLMLWLSNVKFACQGRKRLGNTLSARWRKRSEGNACLLTSWFPLVEGLMMRTAAHKPGLLGSTSGPITTLMGGLVAKYCSGLRSDWWRNKLYVLVRRNPACAFVSQFPGVERTYNNGISLWELMNWTERGVWHVNSSKWERW